MEEQRSSKKIYIILGVALLVIVLSLVAILFLGKGKGVGTGTTSFGALFGNSGTDTPRTGKTTINAGKSLDGSDAGGGGDTIEPLFKQLTTIEVAGATPIQKDGRSYVRYVARENGYVYDVDVLTGASTQLTDTTIPRIYEAFWANSGNTVILRYLKHDDITRKDVIKTYMANLVLPDQSTGSSTTLGSLTGSDALLPDDILSVSVSPNGLKMFYLLPVTDGVSGTIVDVRSHIATEVFRNSFSEWLSQLLDTGNVILTSKASANVPGYAYLYDTNEHTLTRIVREKNGLTTLATPNGDRMIYSENLSGNTILSLYDKTGFELDEGGVTHTSPLQLATLPEKCAWSANRVRIYCGAFASTPSAQVPDDWYQGALSFSDTFWTINSSLSDLVFLADPKKEVGKTLDVFEPFVDKTEDHFLFIDKNDATLWSMRLERGKFTSSDELPVASDTPTLSPDEMKDAAGSIPTTTKAVVKKVLPKK